MQLLGTQFTISSIFDKCSYWTLNRALLKNDPNNSHIVNPTYSMSEDDRQYFFNDYFTTACSELSQLLIYYRKKLFVNNLPANSINAMDLNFTEDYVIYYLLVGEKFTTDIFMPLCERFLQFSVLYYWYWLKNLYEEREYCSLELERIKNSILNIKNEFANEKTARQIYNNGFTINPKQEQQHWRLEPVIITEQTNTGWANPATTTPDNPIIPPPIVIPTTDNIFSTTFNPAFA